MATKKTKSQKAKAEKKTTPRKPKADGKMSCIDAAHKVLTEKSGPMNCQQMIDEMATKGYWKSPNGKTPAATLYSSLLREIANKGTESRFRKADRGTFEAVAAK